VILHRFTKFYPNWTTNDRVITLCRFPKMPAILRPYRRKSTSAFRCCDVSRGLSAIAETCRLWLRLTFLKVYCAYQISSRYLNTRLRYYYFSHTGILFPVSILTFSPPSKLDNRRRSYDVISILQDGGHCVANVLPVSGLFVSDT